MNSSNDQSIEDMRQATVRHYNDNASAFWQGTKDHDVSQNINALLKHLPEQKKLRILDLGCGPGRDVMQLKNLGHLPSGLDACPAFCKMARDYTGCDILQQDFCDLQLQAESFDGIFANASLFHVPAEELPQVLGKLHDALYQNGVLFSSNPRGNGQHFDGSRFGNYMEFDIYATFLKDAGFEVVHHYYRPSGLPCSQQPWLAVVARKTLS